MVLKIGWCFLCHVKSVGVEFYLCLWFCVEIIRFTIFINLGLLKYNFFFISLWFYFSIIFGILLGRDGFRICKSYFDGNHLVRNFTIVKTNDYKDGGKIYLIY